MSDKTYIVHCPRCDEAIAVPSSFDVDCDCGCSFEGHIELEEKNMTDTRIAICEHTGKQVKQFKDAS